MALCSFSSFPAPKALPNTTLAPEENPTKKPVRSIEISPLELTAASAVVPTKRPTTMESTLLYSCWNS